MKRPGNALSPKPSHQHIPKPRGSRQLGKKHGYLVQRVNSPTLDSSTVGTPCFARLTRF